MRSRVDHQPPKNSSFKAMGGCSNIGAMSCSLTSPFNADCSACRGRCELEPNSNSYVS